MSVPDEFFKTNEESRKTPYASAVLIILVVALVVWGVMAYVEKRQADKLMQSPNGGNLSAEEKQKILDQLSAKTPIDPVTAEDKKKVLNQLSKKPQTTTISAEEKQAILDSLKAK